MLLLSVNPLETVIDLPRHVSFETPDDLLLGQSLLDPPCGARISQIRTRGCIF